MAFLNGPNRHLGTLCGISTVCHNKWCGRSQPHIVEILDEMMMSGLTPISQFDNCASLCIFATTWSLRCTLPAMEPHRNVWASAESDSPKTPNAPRGETSALVQLPMPRRGSNGDSTVGGWVELSPEQEHSLMPLSTSPLWDEGCWTHPFGTSNCSVGTSNCCQTRPERPRRMTDLTRLGVWRQVNPRVATLVGSRKCNSRKKKTFFLVGQPESQHPHESPNVHI